jgi:hypothetical protein
MFLSHGPEIQEYLRSLGGYDYTQSGVRDFQELLIDEPSNIKDLREKIKVYNTLTAKDDPLPREIENFKINCLQVPLVPFNKDEVLDGFFSTYWFIEDLTQVSIKILGSDDRLNMLKNELRRINLKLPAAAYIPFSSHKARNCAVLHIPVSEAKVFTTKERAPFMICLEVFNPYKEFSK